MTNIEAWKHKHRDSCGYTNSIDVFINPVTHIVLSSMSYFACRRCDEILCSYCKNIDKRENRLNHSECLERSRRELKRDNKRKNKLLM